MSGIQMALLGASRPRPSVVANDVFGFDSGPAFSGNVSTLGDSPNTTASGGTPPYTYAWSHVSTSSGNTPTISSATAQNPYWFVAAEDGISSESVWRVTVTDSVSATGSYDINVSLTWVDNR